MAKKKTVEKEEETITKEETQADIPEEKESAESEIEALKAEVSTLKDKLLRNQAELQNFKRRMNDERIKDRKYANVDLVKSLLTPLDNFELGLMNETEDGKLKPYAKGFEMIRRDLYEVLKGEGLKEIEALNQPFDPNKHQAVMKEPLEGTKSDMVIEVYQKGYMFKDRVIRPAMVKVSE